MGLSILEAGRVDPSKPPRGWWPDRGAGGSQPRVVLGDMCLTLQVGPTPRVTLVHPGRPPSVVTCNALQSRWHL